MKNKWKRKLNRVPFRDGLVACVVRDYEAESPNLSLERLNCKACVKTFGFDIEKLQTQLVFFYPANKNILDAWKLLAEISEYNLVVITYLYFISI